MSLTYDLMKATYNDKLIEVQTELLFEFDLKTILGNIVSYKLFIDGVIQRQCIDGVNQTEYKGSFWGSYTLRGEIDEQDGTKAQIRVFVKQNPTGTKYKLEIDGKEHELIREL